MLRKLEGKRRRECQRMRWFGSTTVLIDMSLSISPSSEHSGLISFRIDWFDLLAVQESSPAPQFKSISSLALRLLYQMAKLLLNTQTSVLAMLFILEQGVK